MTAPTMTPADVAHAALLEAGRPDLAGAVVWQWNPDGTGYLELTDHVRTADRWLVDMAEELARAVDGGPA